MYKPLPSKDILNSKFKYVDGKLFEGSREVGRELNGKWTVKVFGERFLRSRIIYAMHHEDPKDLQIDHIDRNGLNDRLENLRLASASDNSTNRGYDRKLPTGVYVSGAKFRACYSRKYLGLFDTVEEARHAYLEEKNK